MQMAELGCLETPLALTNTFSVGAIATAQIRAAVSAHPEVGREWSTVNPLVLECNDGYLNDIQALAVTEKHYIEACASASRDSCREVLEPGGACPVSISRGALVRPPE